MLVGHYTTALIANQKVPKGSLLYFLVLSQLPDLLWIVFHYLGLEETTPDNISAVSLDTLMVDMIYSHDLLPILIWMLLAFIVGRIVFKDKKVGIAGSILIGVHALVDYIGGYPHSVFGPDTISVGTGLYYSHPYLAVAFEALFTIAVLVWFFNNEKDMEVKRTINNKRGIIGIFAFGVLFMFSVADLSPAEAFGFDPPDFLTNSAIPSLLVTYLLFIYLINKFVKKTMKEY